VTVVTVLLNPRPNVADSVPVAVIRDLQSLWTEIFVMPAPQGADGYTKNRRCGAAADQFVFLRLVPLPKRAMLLKADRLISVANTFLHGITIDWRVFRLFSN
jgi:hypothetical protein